MDHDHLFVAMAMRRMRRLAGSQFGHVKLDGEPGVRFPLEDGTRAVHAARMDGKVLEAVSIRAQGLVLWRALTGGTCRRMNRSECGGKQKMQISA